MNFILGKNYNYNFNYSKPFYCLCCRICVRFNGLYFYISTGAICEDCFYTILERSGDIVFDNRFRIFRR
jgi:hypothetical protein